MKVVIVASLLISTASWGYNRSTLESIPSGHMVDKTVIQEIRVPASQPTDGKKHQESKKNDHKQQSGTGTG